MPSARSHEISAAAPGTPLVAIGDVPEAIRRRLSAGEGDPRAAVAGNGRMPAAPPGSPQLASVASGSTSRPASELPSSPRTPHPGHGTAPGTPTANVTFPLPHPQHVRHTKVTSPCLASGAPEKGGQRADDEDDEDDEAFLAATSGSGSGVDAPHESVEDAMNKLIVDYSRIGGCFRMRFVFAVLFLLGVILFIDFMVLARSIMVDYLNDSGKAICANTASNMQNQLNLFRIDVVNFATLMHTYPAMNASDNSSRSMNTQFVPDPTVVDACSMFFGGVLAYARFSPYGIRDLFRACPGNAALLASFNETIPMNMTPHHVLQANNSERYIVSGENVVYALMGYPFEDVQPQAFVVMLSKQVFGTFLFSTDYAPYSTATLLRETTVGIFLAPESSQEVPTGLGTTSAVGTAAAAPGQEPQASSVLTAMIHTLTASLPTYNVPQPTALSRELETAFVEKCAFGNAHTWYSSVESGDDDSLLWPIPDPFVDDEVAVLCGTLCIATEAYNDDDAPSQSNGTKTTTRNVTNPCEPWGTKNVFIVVKTVIQDEKFQTIFLITNTAATADIVLSLVTVLSLYISLGFPVYLLNKKIRSVLTGQPMKLADFKNRFMLATQCLWMNDMTALLHIFHVMAAFFVSNRKYVPPYVLHRQLRQLRETGQMERIMHRDEFFESDITTVGSTEDEDEDERRGRLDRGVHHDHDAYSELDDGDGIEMVDMAAHGVEGGAAAAAAAGRPAGGLVDDDELQRVEHALRSLAEDVSGSGVAAGNSRRGGSVESRRVATYNDLLADTVTTASTANASSGVAGLSKTRRQGGGLLNAISMVDLAATNTSFSLAGAKGRTNVTTTSRAAPGDPNSDLPPLSAANVDGKSNPQLAAQSRSPLAAPRWPSLTTTAAVAVAAGPSATNSVPMALPDMMNQLSCETSVTILVVQLVGVEEAFVSDFFVAERQHRKVVAAINAVIRRHKGEVFERTGDRVSVAWNAFEARADHAVRAVRCATDIAALFRQFRRDGLRMGIVVHQGPVVCGIVGDHREAASVLFGQTAEHAVRLAVLAAQLPYFNVLVSEPVKKAVSIFFECVIVDVVRDREIDAPLALFDVRQELNAARGTTATIGGQRGQPTNSDFVVGCATAFALFRAHQFRDAQAQLQALQSTASYADDMLVGRLSALCAYYDAHREELPRPYCRWLPRWDIFEYPADPLCAAFNGYETADGTNCDVPSTRFANYLVTHMKAVAGGANPTAAPPSAPAAGGLYEGSEVGSSRKISNATTTSSSASFDRHRYHHSIAPSSLSAGGAERSASIAVFQEKLARVHSGGGLGAARKTANAGPTASTTTQVDAATTVQCATNDDAPLGVCEMPQFEEVTATSLHASGSNRHTASGRSQATDDDGGARTGTHTSPPTSEPTPKTTTTVASQQRRPNEGTAASSTPSQSAPPVTQTTQALQPLVAQHQPLAGSTASAVFKCSLVESMTWSTTHSLVGGAAQPASLFQPAQQQQQGASSLPSHGASPVPTGSGRVPARNPSFSALQQSSLVGIPSQNMSRSSQEESGKVLRPLPTRIESAHGSTYVRSSRILGTGSFGCVYLGMEQHTGRLVAMKFLPLPSDEAEVRVLQNEVVTMETVTDANLVEFYGYAFVDNMIVLMMECLVAGSLAGMLTTFAALPEQTTINFVRDVLRGLHRLHSMGIVHRDVKPQNVLIAANGHCKISDFGASASIHELVRRHDGGAEVQGTPIYLAPEAARGHAEPKSDVWSVGIMYLQLTTGSIPYDAGAMGAGIGAVVFGIGSGRLRPTIPEDLSPLARAFVEGCLADDAKQRRTAEQLLELPFFCVF